MSLEIEGLGPTVTFAERLAYRAPQLLDATVLLTGATWLPAVVVTVSGLLPEDRVFFHPTDEFASLLGIVGGGVGTDLVIRFANTGMTRTPVEAVQALLSALTYANLSENPTATRDLTVTVEGSSAGRAEATITVVLTDDNAAPIIQTAGRWDVSPAREGVAAVFRGWDPDGTPLTWSLQGPDAGAFILDVPRGHVIFAPGSGGAAPADADGDGTYAIRLQASDGEADVAQDIAIRTVAAGAPPVLAAPTFVPRFAENGTGIAYQALALDPDGQPITWRLGGADAADFTIDAQGAVRFVTPPNFEAPADANRDNAYDLLLVATGGADVVSAPLTIMVTDVVDRAPVVAPIGPITVAENELGTLAQISIANPDSVAFNISLQGADSWLFDQEAFAATRTLRFLQAPDFEHPRDSGRNNVYDVVVSIAAEDSASQSNVPISVTVTNVAGPPEIIAFTAVDAAEGTTGALYQPALRETDGDPVIWSLAGPDARFFAINPVTGAVFFQGTPSFEDPKDIDGDNVYELVLRASDGSASDTSPLSLRITETPESGDLVLGRTAVTTAEDGGPALLAPLATYARSAAPAGGQVVVSGLLAGDRIGILHQGDGAGQIGFDGTTLRFGGVAIGSASSDGGRFTVALNLDADVPAVQALLRSLTYRTTSDAPAAERTLRIDVVDAAGAHANAPEVPVFAPFAVNPLAGVGVGLSSGSDRIPAFADLDNDGLTDIVLGGGNAGFSAWRNTGGGYVRFTPDPVAGLVTTPTTGVVFFDANGDGRLDLLATVETGPLEGVQTFLNTPGGFVRQPESVFAASFPLPIIERHMSLAPFDVNGDGHPDIVFGDSTNLLRTFLATPEGLVLQPDDPLRGPDGAPLKPLAYLLRPALADLNGDGLADLVVGSFGFGAVPPVEALQAFRGVTADSWAYFTAPGEPAGARLNLFPSIASPSWKTPAFVDLDGDGRLDLVASGSQITSLRNVTEYGATITVAVTPVDDLPRFTSPAAVSVLENTTSPVLVVGAFDPEGDAFTLSLEGPDANAFTFAPATGLLRFAATPDFESPRDGNGDNVYDLVLRATAAGGASSTQALRVTVTNVNEPPVFVGIRSSFQVAENTRPELSTSPVVFDSDGDAATFSLAGVDASLFTVDPASGALRFASAPDFETPRGAAGGNTYGVSLVVTAGQHTAVSPLISISVTDVNEPLEIVTPALFNVFENGRGQIFTAIARDPEGTPPLTWSLTGTDAALFAIDAATGQISLPQPLDYEASRSQGVPNVYNLILRAEGGGQVATQAVAVRVIDLDEPPQVTLLPGATPIAENTSGDVYSGVIAIDPEGEPVRWSLTGTDASLFSVDRLTGSIRFRSPPDFEAPRDASANNVYDVELVATAGFQVTRVPVALTVTDVDEAPVITLSAQPVAVPEHVVGVQLATAVDPEGTPVTWTLGGIDAGAFTLAPTGALAFFRQYTDFEAPGDADGDNIYEITLTATSAGQSSTVAARVQVTNVIDDISVYPASQAFVAEATAGTFFTFTGGDADGTQTVRWSISGGDSALFALDATTGALRFLTPPDFEAPRDRDGDNVYTFQLTGTTDEGGLYSNPVFRVTVTDRDDNATIGGSADALLRLATDRTASGQLTIEDITPGEAGFRPATGLQGRFGSFTFDPVTGAWSYVADPKAPAAAFLQDGQGGFDGFTAISLDGTARQDVVVVVVGANDAPVLTLPATASVAENRTGAAIAAVSASDPDFDDRVTFTVDDARFQITGGQLRLKAGIALDFEAAAQLPLVVRATDRFGGETEATLLLTVLDGPDRARITGQATGLLREDSVVSATGQLVVTDADAGQARLADPGSPLRGSYGSLAVDAATGRWSYALDNESDAIQALGRADTVTDSFVLSSLDGSAQARVTLTIRGANEAPVLLAPATVTVAENQAGAPLARLVATDADVGDVVTFGVSDRRFTVVDGELRLKPGVSLDFEATPTLSLVVTATDLARATTRADITVTVLDGPDGASISGALAGRVNEDGVLTASGVVTVRDQDAGEARLADPGGSLLGSYGSLTVDAATGRWSYALDNESDAIQALGRTDIVTDSFVLASLDGSAQARVTLTIRGANDAPVPLVPATVTVAENQAGAAIMRLAATDVDAGDAVTFGVSDRRFTVVDGELRLKPGVTLDFEATPTLSLVVTATDLARSSARTAVTVTVLDGPDRASIGGGLAGLVIEDGLQTASGVVRVRDQDAGEARLADPGGPLRGSHGSLTVDATTGGWSYTLDNDAAAVQALHAGERLTDRIAVTSLDGSASADVVITVLGRNDAPVLAMPATAAVTENQAGAAIAAIGATDRDAGDAEALAFTVSDSRFEVSGGLLRLKAGVALDAEAAASLRLTVVATDPTGLTSRGTITLRVDDVPETPLARDDRFVTAPGVVLQGGAGALLANDRPGDGPLRVQPGTFATLEGGTVTLLADGGFTYRPRAGFNGTDGFAYAVRDADGQVATAHAAVDVVLPPVRLADIAAGIGGFAIIGSGGSALGVTVAGPGDVDGDGLDDILVGTSLGGYGLLVLGKTGGAPVNAADVLAGTGGFALPVKEVAAVAQAPGAPGDFDGDGVPDLLGWSAFEPGGPGAFVQLGATSRLPITVTQPGQQLLVLRGIGDFDGDGAPDILTLTNVGTGHIVLGGAANAARGLAQGGIDASAPAAGVLQLVAGANSQIQSLTALGDVDGDGRDDLALQLATFGPAGFSSRAAVVFGREGGGAVDLAAAAAGTGGFALPGAEARIGSIAAAGDVDGDGRADLLFSAFPPASDALAAVAFGRGGGTPLALADVVAGEGGFAILKPTGAGAIGSAQAIVKAAAGIGDVNGDGRDDLLLAITGEATASDAGIYVIFGRAGEDAIALDDIAAGRGGFMLLRPAGDNVELVPSALGDVNGDGLADFAIGDWGRGPSLAGQVQVVFGQPGWFTDAVLP